MACCRQASFSLGTRVLAGQRKLKTLIYRTMVAHSNSETTLGAVLPPDEDSKGAEAGGLSTQPEQYPEVRRDDFTEELHGVAVPDPYRWLEDTDSAETKSFVDAQNVLSNAVLKECEGREELKAVLTKLMDYPRQGVPYKRGSLQNQSVIYSCEGPGEPGEVFYDPNSLSADGTTSLSSLAFSKDGKFVAASLSEKGSDWRSIQVLQVPAQGPPTEMGDRLKYVKFSSASWTADNLGFFYSRYQEPATDDLGTEIDTAENHLIMYHRLGTPQSSDVFVFATPDHPTWILNATVESSGRWLWVSASDGCVPAQQVWVVDVDAQPRGPDGGLCFDACVSHNIDVADKEADSAGKRGALHSKMTHLANNWESSFTLIAAEGSKLTIRTNAGAPRNRIVSLDVSTAVEGCLSSGSFQEVLAQHPKDLMQDATALKGDMMVVQWMHDVADIADVRRLSDGALLATLADSTPGTYSGIYTEPKRASTEFWFSKETFVEPPAIFRCDASAAAPPSTHPSEPPTTLEPSLFHRTPLKVPHNPDDFISKQVFVESKDGTKVPMFVVHRKGAKLGPSTPALLYGYGGFDVSIQPVFSASWLTWIKAYDGVFALANLRGGGEYGREWRDAGSLLQKQNVFDDMHACAQHLSAEGYTSPACLTINGGSNGGLLVCACALQKPALYNCVISQVPVTDMLRYHKFTIGHAWRTDFGDPEDAAMFAYLRRYSPYHNVRAPAEGQLPAFMLTTASHDDRVVPLHSYKMVAELQHQLVKHAGSTQTNPLIARIDTNAGHGAGKPTSKRIEESADMLAFAAAACGAKLVPI